LTLASSLGTAYRTLLSFYATHSNREAADDDATWYSFGLHVDPYGDECGK